MKINGWDISEADAKQWNVTPGYHSVSNDSEWVRGSPIPAMFRNEIGFKTIKIALLIKADGRQAILGRCSEILAHLLEPADFTLDGFEHRFYGVLKKHTFDENPLNLPFAKYNRAARLTLEVECYEYAVQADGTPFSVSASGATTILINNPGNIPTPAIIEITPQIGAASIGLTGICREPETGGDLPVTIRELTAGNTVILDGETGLITQDGKLKSADVDIWALPSLLPGDNKITVNNDRMDLTIKFRPRFM